MLSTISTVLQVIVGLGLLNVWLLRRGSATAYRGGTAKNLKDEFAAYGLPPAAFYVVGILGAVSSFSNAHRMGRLDSTIDELAHQVGEWVTSALTGRSATRATGRGAPSR